MSIQEVRDGSGRRQQASQGAGLTMRVLDLGADGDLLRRPGLALDTPRGAWVAVYYWSFLAVLALACAIPHQAAASRS